MVFGALPRYPIGDPRIARRRLQFIVPQQGLNDCRHRLEGAQPEAHNHLADCFRGAPEVRRDLSGGTLDQRAKENEWLFLPCLA